MLHAVSQMPLPRSEGVHPAGKERVACESHWTWGWYSQKVGGNAAAEKKGPSEKRVAAQKAVDSALEGCVAKTEHLKDYLRSLFTLRKGQYPHEMKF